VALLERIRRHAEDFFSAGLEIGQHSVAIEE
jgi:hypothetical protein